MWVMSWCLGCKHWAHQEIGRLLLDLDVVLVMVRLCVTCHGFLSQGYSEDEIVLYFLEVNWLWELSWAFLSLVMGYLSVRACTVLSCLVLGANSASLNIGSNGDIYSRPIDSCLGNELHFSVPCWPLWRSARVLSYSSGPCFLCYLWWGLPLWTVWLWCPRSVRQFTRLSECIQAIHFRSGGRGCCGWGHILPLLRWC